MDNNLWDDVDTNDIKYCFAAKKSASPLKHIINTTKIDEIAIAPAVIESISFLKYVHVALEDKIGILNFYDNLCTQGIHYKVFLCLSDKINNINGVKYTYTDREARSTIAITLYSKCNQIGTINDSYTDAKKSTQYYNGWFRFSATDVTASSSFINS